MICKNTNVETPWHQGNFMKLETIFYLIRRELLAAQYARQASNFILDSNGQNN